VSSLCLCLTESSYEGSLSQLNRYRPYIGMVEMRLDLLDPTERIKAADLPFTAGMPTILTIRLPDDGGNWGKKGETEDEREELLITLLRTGQWTYVDLEYNRLMEKVAVAANDAGTRVIRSRHDFKGTMLDLPVSELAGIVRGMGEDGSIPKLAVCCTGSRQLLTLARTALATESQESKVLLGMGEFGTPSRILAERLGSAWTYTSANGRGKDAPLAAPGQLDPASLQNLYRYSKINQSTPLYAIAGDPISHSQSPRLHNNWLQSAELEGTYLPIRVDDIAAFVETCDIWGIRGLSVTVPHKEKALALCDYSGHLARRIGAANTLLRAGDGWRARNTDAEGFVRPLPDAMELNSLDDLKGKRALIIGAGGAARAAVYALTDAGMNLIILNRTEEKARRLAEETGNQWGVLSEKSLPLLADGVDLAVQTTSVGMHPDVKSDPAPWWNPENCTLVYDMIYDPVETVFLSRARSAGVNTMNGSGMLEGQARLQFELFTGHQAPV
jgi:3-dehydroquinate dehydratase/shikimate dehydrogenase